MHKITRESLRQAGACYSDERIAELVPPEGLTPAEVAAKTDLPVVDRHWALVHAAGASARILRQHACWCARRALKLVDSPDPSSVAAVEVAERFAIGEATQDELFAAWDSARNSATYAARYAATDAARAAAWAAATDAAWAAAWAAATDAAPDAARYAARYAATDAARYAAWDAQLQDLVSRIEGDSEP